MIDEEERIPDFSNDPVFQEHRTETIMYGSCPHCGTRNKVHLGDMSDSSAPEVEVVLCWNCKKKSWLGEDTRSLAYDYGHESIDDGYSEEGRQ